VLAGVFLFSLLTVQLMSAQLPPVKDAPQLPTATPPAQPGPVQSPIPPDYSQESYVVEHNRQVMRYENDGTGREELTAQIRIVSESGVQGLGQLKIGYSAASDKLDIVYVRVRKPDGTVVTAEESAIQDLTATPNAPVYTDYHEKHVSVPSLRPGDVLEYELVRTIVNPLAPNQFWTSYSFAETGVVLDEELEINVPKSRHIKLKTRPGYDPKVTDEGDRRVYRWTHSHLKDQNPKTSQPKLPSPANQIPSVQLTTFESWDDLGAWYGFLERERRQPNDAVKAKAAELVQGKTDDMEKVKALYDYVSRNIRYVSLSFGLGRIQPHAASEVLANGYGDCKDKNTLLAALLQAEGIESSSVLIGSQHKLDPDIPSPSQFDHVITLVPVDGQQIWLDSTNGVAPFRMLLSPLRDKQALALPPGGTPELVRTPANLPFASFDGTSIVGSLNDTGKLTVHLSIEERGDVEVTLRLLFRLVPNNKLNEVGDGVVGKTPMKGGEVTNFKISDLNNTDKPVEMSFDATAHNYFDW